MNVSPPKLLNLTQLQQELAVAMVSVDALGADSQPANEVFTYDLDGQRADFRSGDQATVAQVITNHVAMRDKTDAEYAAEFQDPTTTVQRKQEIRDITAGLLPREQVPVDPSQSVPVGRSAPPEPSTAHAQIAAATDLEQLKNALLEAIP